RPPATSLRPQPNEVPCFYACKEICFEVCAENSTPGAAGLSLGEAVEQLVTVLQHAPPLPPPPDHATSSLLLQWLQQESASRPYIKSLLHNEDMLVHVFRTTVRGYVGACFPDDANLRFNI
ncbi:hypothetical protein L9F63_019692, partial [Diploptera punctata]